MSLQAMTIRCDELGVQDRQPTRALRSSQGALDDDTSNVPAWAPRDAMHLLQGGRAGAASWILTWYGRAADLGATCSVAWRRNGRVDDISTGEHGPRR